MNLARLRRGVAVPILLAKDGEPDCLTRGKHIPLSANGTFLNQPRVQRRESTNVAEPWEKRFDRTRSPNGAALTDKVI
jgi:hypothetical protein